MRYKTSHHACNKIKKKKKEKKGKSSKYLSKLTQTALYNRTFVSKFLNLGLKT